MITVQIWRISNIRLKIPWFEVSEILLTRKYVSSTKYVNHRSDVKTSTDFTSQCSISLRQKFVTLSPAVDMEGGRTWKLKEGEENFNFPIMISTVRVGIPSSCRFFWEESEGGFYKIKRYWDRKFQFLALLGCLSCRRSVFLCWRRCRRMRTPESMRAFILFSTIHMRP